MHGFEHRKDDMEDRQLLMQQVSSLYVTIVVQIVI